VAKRSSSAEDRPAKYADVISGVRERRAELDRLIIEIVSQLRSWVNAPSPNRFSGLWLLNYAPGWPTPRSTSDAARPRTSAARHHAGVPSSSKILQLCPDSPSGTDNI
jgi:hypothetical protein